MGHAEAQREKRRRQGHWSRTTKREGGKSITGSLPPFTAIVTFHLYYLHYSDSPPGHAAWTTFSLEMPRWDYMLTKQSMETGPSLQMSFLSSSLSELVVFSPCPHPERSRSSRPIQKCPIIIDLSVLIFINNCACDDPAGMLMSPQLELISCRRRSGHLSIPPWSSAPLSDVQSSAVHFVMGPVDDKTLHEMTFLFSCTPGFHKGKCYPSKIFYFLVKVYVHSLRYSWLCVKSLHLIRRAISSSDRPPRGSWIQRNSSANGSWWALCSF